MKIIPQVVDEQNTCGFNFSQLKNWVHIFENTDGNSVICVYGEKSYLIDMVKQKI